MRKILAFALAGSLAVPAPSARAAASSASGPRGAPPSAAPALPVDAAGRPPSVPAPLVPLAPESLPLGQAPPLAPAARPELDSSPGERAPVYEELAESVEQLEEGAARDPSGDSTAGTLEATFDQGRPRPVPTRGLAAWPARWALAVGLAALAVLPLGFPTNGPEPARSVRTPFYSEAQLEEALQLLSDPRAHPYAHSSAGSKLAAGLQDDNLGEKRRKALLKLFSHGARTESQKMESLGLLMELSWRKGDREALNALLEEADAFVDLQRERAALQKQIQETRAQLRQENQPDWNTRLLPGWKRLQDIDIDLTYASPFYSELASALGIIYKDTMWGPKTHPNVASLKTRMLGVLLGMAAETPSSGMPSARRRSTFPPAPKNLCEALVTALGDVGLPEGLVPLTKSVRQQTARFKADKGFDYVELDAVLPAMQELLGRRREANLSEDADE